MVISHSQSTNGSALPALCCPLRKFEFYHLGALLVWVLLLMGAVCGQGVSGAESEEKVVLVNGVTNSTVFGMGKSLRITGTVKQGAMSFGGDVIVEGAVEGDVAAIGGSVIQRENSRIGGDVIVLGGTFRSEGEKPPNRNPAAMTMVFAGYQQELGDLMRSPSSLLKPHWSPGYFGMRLLVILFWFIICLAFTAAMPGTISRGVARLQLTSLRVAFIGLIGVVIMGAEIPICLFLPQTISVLVGLLTLVLIVVAGLFGRVMLYAATGRWLQRKYVPIGKSSEAVALLLGTAFWVILASLPYAWPFVVAVIWVLSLGLALTARYRVGWHRAVSPTF